MTPTLIGGVVVAIGLLLLFTASRLAMLGFVLVCSLFNGSATVILTALGNVSIQPALTATGFLLLRCLLPGRRREPLLGASLADNGWLLVFAAYSIAGAYTLPFLFRGAIAVVPLRPTTGPSGLVTLPLQFTTQNITTSVYIALSAVGAICAHMAMRRADAAPRIARLASVLALSHAAIGWFAALVNHTPAAVVIGFLRNGYYRQLDQSFDGYARLTGISPEPSQYASYGFVWFVFVTELWLRNIDRRWSGPAALALFVTLLASTSSTAYVGLTGYGAVLAVRQIYFARTIPLRKSIAIAACILTLAGCGLALIAGSDQLARAIGRVLRLSTADKLESGSGIARMFWAMQGFSAFLHSWGLGIGVGSFRSSSIVTAILGSSGVIGITAFAVYLGRVFRPFTGATYRRSGVVAADVATAATWAVLLALVPASVSAPSPDPGLVWGLLAGTALGLRRLVSGRYLGSHDAAAASTASIPVRVGHEAGGRSGYRAGPGKLRPASPATDPHPA